MFRLSRSFPVVGDLVWKRERKTVRRAESRVVRRVPSSRIGVQGLEERVMPTLLGEQLFPLNNPWNQNISNAPVASNSAAIISHIGASTPIHADWGADSAANGNAPLYGIPINIVHGNSTAMVNVTINNYPGQSDIEPVPIPANAVIEGDYQDGPNPNGPGYNNGQRGDSHLIVWDEDNNIAYELFGVSRPSDPTIFPNASGVEAKNNGTWQAAQETVWNMNTNTFRTLGETSADAAGLSILAGLVRPDEALPVSQGGQGAIDHALRFTLPSSDINPQYVYPASHAINSTQGSNNLPLGGRLRLENTAAVNALISAMPPESQVIARAMQQYGLILADGGSAMYVTGTSALVDNVDTPNLDLTWNLNDIFASNGIEELKASDFQVVNLTPVVTGLSATAGLPGTTITVDGQNFSGAAGNLAVFFGTTVATSVTYVSDSQIMVGVPSGTGTVNVTVQSGIKETDSISSNPNANVNAPIFGYGTSAVTSADKFTFSTQTVSGTSSTVSLGNPAVASGSTDLVTIVVEDTTGKAVTGLTSGSFNLSLAGGTSAGTFSAVSPTSTAGTYTATFTGTTAGTASTLSVTVAGVTLVNQPTITVAAGPVSATTSTASFASPVVVSGNSDVLSILLEDAAGNPITGLSGSVSLALGGGTSAGSLGPVVETSAPGTYTATFTSTTAGTASTLTVTVGGAVLSTTPVVQVISGGISASNSTVSFANPTVASGSTDTVTISVEDQAGNPVSVLGSSAFSFALIGVSAGTWSAVVPTATAGMYTATFTGTTAGTASTLSLTAGGVTLLTQPSITVTTGPISATASTASFASPSVASGSGDVLTIVVTDSAGNPIAGLASEFTFVVSGGTSAGTTGTVTATATPGTYMATFTGTTAGTASTVAVTVDGVNLTTQPAITVTPGPVSASTSTVSFATSSVASGKTDLITVVVKDAAGNPISGLAGSAFGFVLSGGTSGGTFGAVSAGSSAGTYTVTFTGTTAGTPSTLTTTASGVVLSITPTVQVVAGSPGAANSTVTFASSTVTSGSTDVVTIVVMDSSGNPISGLASSAFRLSLSGGTSAGTFSSVTATSTPGTYTATFTATTAGTASTLTTSVSGVTLTARPTVKVSPGTVNGSKSRASFASSSVNTGSTDVLTIVVEDASGNAITGLSSSAFTFALSGGTSAGTFGTVTATSTPGTYTVTFTGTTAGTASTVDVTISGVALVVDPSITVTVKKLS